MPKSKAASDEPDGKSVDFSGLVTDPNLRRLFDYWREKRQGRPMPSKSDIDPLDIGWALARLFLMDYLPTDGFRYRLAGGEISKVYGRGNLKGLNLRDLLQPQLASDVEQLWQPLVQDRSVICMRGMIYFASDRAPVGERLLLPLADEAAGPVTGVLGMTVCSWDASKVPREMRLPQTQTLPVAEIP